MSKSQKSAGTTRVYEAVPGPGETVKFIDEIVRYAPPDIEFSFHSWGRAIFGRYDLVHFHWPEFYVRDISTIRRSLKRIVFLAFLARIRLTRTPIVRTIHNVKPHQPGDAGERRLLRVLEKSVRRYVVMSSSTPVDPAVESVLVPHGDFLEVFRDLPRETRVKGRVLLFGRLHPYKGALELIEAATQVKDAHVEIRIVGSPTPDMRILIEDRIKRYDGTARVSVHLQRVTDAEMVAEMTKADLVALPYQDAGNGNSGVAMVALSLNRPVLVYRSALMEELASETGRPWVQMMDSELSGEEIELALQNIGHLEDDDAPRLVNRDWQSIASSYAAVFREVARGR